MSKGDDTRAFVLSAAMSLASEEGLSGITIGRIFTPLSSSPVQARCCGMRPAFAQARFRHGPAELVVLHGHIAKDGDEEVGRSLLPGQ